MGNICDTTDLMIHGHVPWLELPGSHAHPGGTAEVRLFWGRDMQPDGLLRRDNLAVQMLTPGGAMRDLTLLDGGPDYYSLYFPAHEEGFYHVVAKHCGSFVMDGDGNYIPGTRQEHPDADRGTFCIQYAQVFVPAGHDINGKPAPAGGLLEFVPDVWRQWRTGDEIHLQVQYNGRPLAALRVDLATRGGPSGCWQWRETTDGDGRFRLLAREACRYLATVHYQVQQADTGFHNSLQVDSTLSLMVLKQGHHH